MIRPTRHWWWASAVVVLLIVLVALDFWGIIWHNAPLAAAYSIKGLDVSHHQKQIDWPRVAATKKYSFVFIKATEGHDFTDDDFSRNWREAKENGLLVGAYHFFSMRSPGVVQAEHFIATVPKESGVLPPVIDIEISDQLDPVIVRNELKSLAHELEGHYQQKPILYLTYNTYYAYIQDHFDDHVIWMRDVLTYPHLVGRRWEFWQYSNRGWVPGISTQVDLNVFRGSRAELEALTKPSPTD